MRLPKLRQKRWFEMPILDQMQTLVLRPRFIWGPGDTTILPALEQMAESGGWMWVNDGQARTSSTHIDNLVHAIELTLTKGEGGGVWFVLDDGVHTLRHLVEGMARSRGVDLGNKNVPAWLVRSLAYVCESIWRLFSIKTAPPITRLAAQVMAAECVLDDSKARRELGYKPVISVEDGLRELADLAVENHLTR